MIDWVGKGVGFVLVGMFNCFCDWIVELGLGIVYDIGCLG